MWCILIEQLAETDNPAGEWEVTGAGEWEVTGGQSLTTTCSQLTETSKAAALPAWYAPFLIVRDRSDNFHRKRVLVALYFQGTSENSGEKILMILITEQCR